MQPKNAKQRDVPTNASLSVSVFPIWHNKGTKKKQNKNVNKKQATKPNHDCY